MTQQSSPQAPGALLETLRADRESLSRSSTSGRVATVLRDHITAGRLAPGTRLSEEQLGQALGVSRNTLREAFRLLTHEQLLSHEFNRGVFVRRLEVEDVRDLYRLRRILECGAVRRAAAEAGSDPSLVQARVQAVREAVQEAEAAAAEDRWVDVGTANMHFHQAIAALAGSPRTDETMRRVLAELRLVFHVMAAPRTFHERYLPGNRAIADLLAAGEFEAAERELGSYLDAAEAQLVEAYRLEG
ncbi:MAG: GntR family transcriptional regulator [Nocardioides sp.]